MSVFDEIRPLLPITTSTNVSGHLEIGGCDTTELARQYGTPLYIFDEQTLRESCRQYVTGLREAYPNSLVIYACKALVNLALIRLFYQEGLGFDVVSGGELYAIQRAGAPMDKVYLHGNNKSKDDLELALKTGVGRVVVDNFYDLELLGSLCKEMGVRARVLLRLSPGVEAHTHDYIKTGVLDSKFGLPIITGDGEKALTAALKNRNLEVLGLHCHIGSQIFELAPYEEVIDRVFTFAAEMKGKYRFEMREFSPGGGWGIRYIKSDDPLPIADSMRTIGRATKAAARKAGLAEPLLILEPGRSIVGRAGLALYTIGSTKVIPNVRKYVAIDGGMADNIRPALYGAKYEALLATRPLDQPEEVVTIAGKYCESGDILLRDISLPAARPGDILAVPASGAYCLAMASNYNMTPRPAVVLVGSGKAKLIRRRESYSDLLGWDVED